MREHDLPERLSRFNGWPARFNLATAASPEFSFHHRWHEFDEAGNVVESVTVSILPLCR